MRITAQAGEAVLLLSLDSGKIENDDEAREGQQAVLTKDAKAIANVCREMGGTLEALGQIIEALVAPEILRSKCVVVGLILHMILTEWLGKGSILNTRSR